MRLAVAAVALCTHALADEVKQLNQMEQLAVVRAWIPFYNDDLKLVFEYKANEEKYEGYDSTRLHKAIDKVGPTVTIIEALNPFEDEPRIVGGYNPYKWKNWLGRYEKEAGQFIFDLDLEEKWDRTPSKPQWVRRSPRQYGLAFGNGDLTIAPDLKTGSARNRTFAPASSTSSVLMGQAGTFQIQSIRVYRVMTDDYAGPPVEPMYSNSYYDPEPPPANHFVPDPSIPFLEISIGLIALVIGRIYFTRS